MPLGNDRGSNKDLLGAIAAGTFTLIPNAVIPNNTDRFMTSQVVSWVYIQPITNRTSIELPRWDELIAVPQTGTSSTVTFTDEVGPLQYVAHDLSSGATFTFTTVGSGTTYTASGTLPAGRSYDFTVSSVTGISTFGITSQGTLTAVVSGSLPNYHFTTVTNGVTRVVAKTAAVTVIGNVQGFNAPHYGAYHPGTGNLFISNMGDRTLKILNTSTSTASLSVPLPAYPGGGTVIGSNARAVIHVPSIDRIWVKDEADYIYEYNPYTNTFISTPVVTPSDLSAVNYGYEMIYVPDIDRVFNFLLLSGHIDVINPHNYLITNTISLLLKQSNYSAQSAPTLVKCYSGVAPGNGFCYVSSYSFVYVVINLSTLTAVNNTCYALGPASNFMAGLTYYNGSDSPDTFYICDTGSSYVYIIKGATNPVTATIQIITVGTSPSSIMYSSVRSVFYVGFYQNNSASVSTFSTATFTQGSSLSSGLSPVDTVYNPANGKMYALNYASNTVSILT